MIEYFDAYLAPLIDQTPEFETRAAQDVALLGTFPAPWPDTLTRLRTYILCCLESMANENDVFSAKLSEYRKEYAETLTAARAAVAVAPTPTGRLVYDLERA